MEPLERRDMKTTIKMVHHHHELKLERRRPLAQSSQKIFILLTIISYLLIVNLLTKCAFAGKGKEKSSKTTVIAISGSQGGKAHPVPVPWPVVHCHHHHHHLKYVPKPVLVHHWVKKFKPVEIEASNEHYSVLESPIHQREQQQQSRLLASSPDAQYQISPQNVLPSEQMSTSSNQLMQGMGPMSLFSQADQSKLPYDLMDGSQLVSALSNAFDPLIHSLSKPAQSANNFVAEPQMTMMLPNEHQHHESSTTKLELFDKDQQLPSYKLADNKTHSGGAHLHEIDKEFNKFHQQRQQPKKLRPTHDGNNRGHSGNGGKPMGQFSNKQLEKLSKSVKSAQKQQQHLKSPTTFDTEPVDSLNSNVVAGDFPSTVPDNELAQQQEQASLVTLGGASALGDLSANAPGKPNHPFDEPQDQLRDETRTDSNQDFVVANRLGMNLNQANMREEVEARRSLNEVSLDQANRLAALNAFFRNSNAHILPTSSGVHPNSLPSKFQAIRPPIVMQGPLAAPTNHLINPAAISARMASVLSESHTIKLMTRLAERMAQLEAKNLLNLQLSEPKASTNKSIQNAAPSNKNSTTRSFFGNFDQMLSLLSPLRGSRDRRRQSITKNFIQLSGLNGKQMTTLDLQPEPSHVKKFIWTTQGNLKPASSQSAPTGAVAPLPQNYRIQTSPATPRPFIHSDVITASPLNLSVLKSHANSGNTQQLGAIINGRPVNPAASSRFMSQRLVSNSRQQHPAASEGLASEGSVLVNKIVEPAVFQDVGAAKQQAARAKVYGQSSSRAEKANPPGLATSIGAQAKSTTNSSQAAQVMNAEQENRFYVGQHEHLEKAKQDELQQSTGQLSLDLHSPHEQPFQVRELPVAKSTRQQAQQAVEEKLVNLAGIKASNTNQLYSSQSSNVRQSVIAPVQEQHEPRMPTAEMSREALRQLDNMRATGQMKSFPFDMQASNGAEATTEQTPPPTQGENAEQQQQSQGHFQMPDQLPSYLEFPMSPEQWSSEAMKSLNARQQSQPQQQPQTEASDNQDQTESGQQDEQPNTNDEEKANDNQEASEADNNQQSNADAAQNQMAPYDLMSANPAAAYQLMVAQQQSQQIPFSFNSALMAPSLQQSSWQQPQAANPYGYYTAGQQQGDVGPPGSLMAQLESSFGPYGSMLSSQEQSQFTTNYNPMTQQPYFGPGANGVSPAGSNVMLSGVQPLSMGPPTMGDYNLARFPEMSSKSAAKLASKGQRMQAIDQSASLLSSSFAGSRNNLTSGFGALTGTLGGNQMQARLPPQLPQVPNIPQPPQMPNLPMPPPGMLQMAASMALPLAMARATRNSNRFRNNQVNAAASNGGSTTTAGQRLLRGVSNVTNRLMRSRRRPSTSPPPISTRPLTHRRQPFVWGRPNGSGSLLSSSSGINISRRRPPVMRFVQTVIDMSHRPPIQMAANLAGTAVLSAAKASIASSSSAASPSASPTASEIAASAAGSVADAAASAVVQAAAAVAADKLKPKIDTKDAVRREGHSSRLSRSLERLQLDLREAAKQRHQAHGALPRGRANSGVVRPGLPAVALTDGSLALFGSMTSPVDLLSRQLAAQPKLRELGRQPLFQASAYEEAPLSDQAAYELMRLNSISSSSAPQRESNSQTAHPSLAASNYELISGNSLQSHNHPSQTPTANPLASHHQLRLPMQAHHMNISHSVPYVANHFNLLMFTAQNVTGNLGLKLPQQPQEQQSNESAGASEAQQILEEQKRPQDQQVVPSSGEQTQQQPQLEDQSTQNQQLKSSDTAQFSDDKQAQPHVDEPEVNRVAAVGRAQLTEGTTRRPVDEQKVQKPVEFQEAPFLFEARGHEQPDEPIIKPDLGLNPLHEQESQTKAVKKSKRRKFNLHGQGTSTQVPHLLSTIEPITSPSTTTTPSRGNTKPPITQWIASEIEDHESLASHDVPSVDSSVQRNRMSATKLSLVKASKSDQLERLPKRKPTTSARPTRAAILATDDSLTDEDQSASGWKSVKTELVGAEKPEKERQIETNKTPEQIETLKRSREELLEPTSFESANGLTTATPAIGDYVRAIKLVRGLAYPWPPPTQSAKMLTAAS